MTCVPSKDSDQPGDLPCLIRVFAVHMNLRSTGSLVMHRRTAKTDHWADQSLLGASVILLVCHAMAYLRI